MGKIDIRDLDYIEEAPSSESRRDIRIKNNKVREEAAHVRKVRMGRIRTRVEWTAE